MLLKFCNDNFLFYITHAKYFDILCIFIVLFFIALFILAQKDEFIDKFKNNNFKKFSIIFLFGLFVGFLAFLFTWTLSKKDFEGCSTKYNMNIYSKMENNLKQKTAALKDSKVIIVGDSRMEFIEDDEEIIIPFNVEFVAKSAMTIDWLRKTALPNVDKILKEDDFEYSVVVNMGVNDLNYARYKGDEIAKDYFNLYSELAHDYPNVKVYILSVNPINEKKRNKTEPGNQRTNKKIELFNNTIQEELDDSDLDNMFYCDAYNELEFGTDDGLHYTKETNREIINYIVNKCVKF